jgi:hypothetical protein
MRRQPHTGVAVRLVEELYVHGLKSGRNSWSMKTKVGSTLIQEWEEDFCSQWRWLDVNG